MLGDLPMEDRCVGESLDGLVAEREPGVGLVLVAFDVIHLLAGLPIGDDQSDDPEQDQEEMLQEDVAFRSNVECEHVPMTSFLGDGRTAPSSVRITHIDDCGGSSSVAGFVKE